ncbi:class B sortase [Allobaculum sp. JKK-2023]|uniref:class B sortase n=1 Tax=Allobaculum sp. JKK-2023 TaxID=3108943 RepID=UPI002B0587B1|nr:class B sortase [Allobaculum sp. JKK-2023]
MKTKSLFHPFKGLMIALMAAVVLLSGCSSEPTKEQEVSKVQEAYHEVQESVVKKPEASTDPIDREIDFAKLKEINPEVIGWIYVPNTEINYPILQSEDNEKYLNTNLNGEPEVTGSIYIENFNAADFSDPVTLVYGHTTFDSTGEYELETMFSELHNFEDPAYFEANPYIYIYTPEKTMKYQIFSAVVFDNRYIPGNYQFLDPVDFQNYLDELRNTPGANVNRDLEVTQDTGILTLSTCMAPSGQPGSDQRLLINATEVQEVAR